MLALYRLNAIETRPISYCGHRFVT